MVCVTLAMGIPSAREAAVVADLGPLWAARHGHPAFVGGNLNFSAGPAG